jgi:YggT family protein
MFSALIYLVDALFTLYFWIVIASVVLSWLIGFNVINPYNPAVKTIQSFCYHATEPALAPIRRFMPDLGGLDISPVVLLLGLEFTRILIIRTLAGQLFS